MSEAAALVDSLSDDELARHLDAGAWLAGAELYLDRYAEADAHATRALAVARATGQGEYFLVLVADPRRGLAPARQAGRGRRAARRRHRGGAPARQHARARLEPLRPLVARRCRWGTSSSRSPPPRRASTSARTPTRASTRPRPPPTSPRRCSRPGSPEPALELLLELAGGEELALIAGSPRARYLELLTRCRLALGRRAEAERAAAARGGLGRGRAAPAGGRAGPIERRPPSSSHAGDAAARSRARARVGRRRRRGRRAGRGSAVAHRSRAARSPRPASATAPRRSCSRRPRELEARGALRYRDEAERELRKLGHRVHRRTRPGKPDGAGVESLTERELQLARLVVDRKTNPEIAAELFLSQKTVETHLRNIFRKVGVSSRVELARAVERAEREGVALPYVGRQVELEAIGGLLAALDGGGPAALAVAGEPGIGKTRLLAELARARKRPRPPHSRRQRLGARA